MAQTNEGYRWFALGLGRADVLTRSDDLLARFGAGDRGDTGGETLAAIGRNHGSQRLVTLW